MVGSCASWLHQRLGLLTLPSSLPACPACLPKLVACPAALGSQQGSPSGLGCCLCH